MPFEQFSIDQLVEARVENGRVVEYIRRGRLRGWQDIGTPDDPGTALDPDASVRLILNDDEFPKPGEFIRVTEGDQQTARKAYLVDYGVELVDTNSAEFTLTYRHFGDTQDDWEIDASLVQDDTFYDRDRVPIADLVHNSDPQGVSLQGTFPQIAMRKSYVRAMEAGETTLQLAERFMGKVNKTAWRGKAPGQWRVTDFKVEIISHGDNGGQKLVLVSAQVELRNEGHQPTPYYLDPQTGRRAVGLIEGEGFFVVNLYPEVDFVQEFGA